MAIPECSINNTGSLTKYLATIKTAGVPERVTFEFLKTLGFKSSNDRPIITIMKAIGFLDSNGTPTDLYKSYRSDDGPKILAKALRDAYEDIFMANTKAHTLSLEKLKGIIASKTTKSDASVKRIASTFQTLVKAADFSKKTAQIKPPDSDQPKAQPEMAKPVEVPPLRGKTPAFHYNIEIHLPTTTDITVYNAIFKSLKENLL